MMSPYIITAITLIMYNGSRFPMEVVSSEIQRRPIRLVKERILDSFARMKEPPVDVELKVKWI